MTVNKYILVGVSGGIAGYKTADLIKLFKTKGIEVRVILTKTAAKMFEKDLFGKASGHTPKSEMVPIGFNFRDVLKKEQVEHIRFADEASVVVIAPATANIIGKIANGIADDLLTTVVMATTAPVIICPSMNIHMWENPIVMENVQKLMKNGYIFVPPEKGRLACGYEGVGRLANLELIMEEALNIIRNRYRLKGKKIIVTAGGTKETIDVVRFISNKASGKMGIAIAEECHLQGADVLLMKAASAVESSVDIKQKIFDSSVQLEKLIKEFVPSYDYIFHSAAVSDFIPVKSYNDKLDSAKDLVIQLKSAPKILHKIKTWNPQIKIIGFKAVYKKTEKDLIKIGRKKLKESNADYIIVNDVGRIGIGFGADDNEVYILTSAESVNHLNKTTKKLIARQIVNLTTK